MDDADSTARPKARVLHVAEAFGGGVFEIVKHLANRQASAGYRVAIAYGRRPETPDESQMGLRPAVTLFALPWRSRNLCAHFKAALALRLLVRRWRPDIVHLHSSFASVVGAIVISRRILRISTPHAYSFTMGTRGRLTNTSLRLLELFAARRVDIVGAVSHSEAAIARGSLGIADVVVVPNGIPELDSNAMQVKYCKAPRPLVVAMGRAEAQRRPHDCAQILGALTDIADVQWIGGMSTSAAGESVLAAHGIQVTGWLPREEAMSRLGEAWAYLHWTAWDGQPLSILEAMARDVVVVASDIAPNREIVGAPQVRATNSDAIALLRSVITDHTVAEHLTQRQRDIRVSYGAERMSAQWMSVYKTGLAPPIGARAHP